jgi:hypothetical protein
MSCLLPIQFVPNLKESVPLDPSGVPVLTVLLLLALIFFNQDSRRRLNLLGRLSLDVLLPYSNLRVMGLDHPIP